eukprot:3619540-Karenia_brevis.AAC.1
MMLRDVPMKSVVLANPMDAASKLEGGALVATNPNMNLGEEHVATKRGVDDFTSVSPETSMTEERRTTFLKALVFVMPEGAIDNMWEYAKTKPAPRRAWNVAKTTETAQH